MNRGGRWFTLAAVALLAMVGGYLVHLWMSDARPRRDPAEVLLAATLTDLAGKPQPISQWRGRVLVVNFWATWCPPCLKEIPEFIRFQERYGAKGLQFVGLAIDSPARVAGFVGQQGVNYPVLMAEAEGLELSREAGNRLGALPFTVVIDRQGRTALVELGVLDEAKLASLVKRLL